VVVPEPLAPAIIRMVFFIHTLTLPVNQSAIRDFFRFLVWVSLVCFCSMLLSDVIAT
jgi:hypothetical protein